MREIKFRAFDAVLGMHDVNVMAGNGTWWQVLVDGKIYTLSESELMQFTGLKDKNGVEIYEGDRYMVMGNRIYEIRWLDGECQHEYYGGCFGLWAGDELFFPFDENALKNGKVIGNIYENDTQEQEQG